MAEVVRVRPLGGYRGMEGERDFCDLVAEGGPMLESLKGAVYFSRVFIEMGAPTWPTGFDLDPINLYMQMRDAGELTKVAAE